MFNELFEIYCLSSPASSSNDASRRVAYPKSASRDRIQNCALHDPIISDDAERVLWCDGVYCGRLGVGRDKGLNGLQNVGIGY